MQRQSNGMRRTPITDAVYGRTRKPLKAKTAAPRREIDPRRTFGIAAQLDPETLRKLEQMGSPRRKRGQ